MKTAIDHYIDQYRGDHASSMVSLPLTYLNEHVKKAEYSEVLNSDSVGPMHQIHALLEIDDRARADIDRLWHSAVVTDRLWYTGSGAALVLALLGTFYGYLRLDLRDRRGAKRAIAIGRHARGADCRGRRLAGAVDSTVLIVLC